MSNGEPEPEEPEEPGEPEPESEGSAVPLELGQVFDDAPLSHKAVWESGGILIPGGPGAGPRGNGSEPELAPPPAELQRGGGEPFVVVLPPRFAATSAPGSREPRRADDVQGAEHAGARHNWIPTGPRNVGGRVRALAVHPGNPLIMFAGAASGGVFRTTDGGETWSPRWHDLPSLAVGAIGICRDHPERIYAATGEVRTGGGEAIPGNGIFRSTDGGDTWTNPMVPLAPGAPPVPGPVPAAGAPDRRGFSFDAVAAHPVNADRCWAVGPAGIFRTTDGGRTWTQFEAGVFYSDAVFSVSAGAGPHPILYLVRAQSRAGEASIVRLDDPDAADAAVAAALANPANTMTVIPAPPAPPAPPPGVLAPAPDRPGRGKLAVCAGSPAVAYVRFTTQNGVQFPGGPPSHGRHAGVFRTRNARVNPPRNATWGRLADHLDWRNERQGNYNLSIAVDPADANNVATGMVDLYVSRNANANSRPSVVWQRAMAFELYHFERGHHEDHHAAVFVPPPAGSPAGTPTALWVTNDGGISRSTDWRTGAGYPSALFRPIAALPAVVLPRFLSLPVPRNAITWRKRSHGIVAGQMYDLTQSPLVPSMYACGFQDNGVHVTTGGPTWRLVMRADGGFVAFDPDDPYRFLATWQEGISEVLFPGRLEGTFPPPGEGIIPGLWPRVLTQGFLQHDPPPFLADTVHHPRQAGRVLHTRINRLYGTRRTTGDLFAPEQVGRGFEILPSPPGGTIDVLSSPGARRLGLVQQRNTLVGPNFRTSIRSFLPEPYELAAGDTLTLMVNGVPTAPITFAPGAAVLSAAEVAAAIRAAAAAPPAAVPPPPAVTAHPCFWSTPATVEITTHAIGAAADIRLGGTALAPLAPGGLSRLGLLPGSYHSTAGHGHAASVTLGFPGTTPEDHRRNRDFSAPPGAPLELTIGIGANPVRRVRFEPPAFPDPGWVRTGELAAAIRAALGADPARVVAHSMGKAIELTDFGGVGLTCTGTACARLNLPVGGFFTFLRFTREPLRDEFLNQNVGNFNSFDLSVAGGAPALRLLLTDNVAVPAPPPLVFDAAADVADLRSVTYEELHRLIDDHINTQGLLLQVDLVHLADRGQPSELAYAPGEPRVAWVGGEDGSVYRTQDDGVHWEDVGDPRFRLRDRPVEAIAIDPRDPERAFVGLSGRTRPGADPGFLFRTDAGGIPWVHVGADVVDSTGALVGVNALEIDPDAPDTIFAATDVGVFRSTNGGNAWQPFNEGLPNALVRDLAFVPATRTLRAGAWGRGTFERHVGDRPPRDVQVYARTSLLDEGAARPAPRGPEGAARTPRAVPVAESPDIKVNRDRPPGIGPDEAVDGVEFDEDIRHEEPLPGASHVYVQVHNRGSFAATATRVVALWADAAAGPPVLPEDFWAKYAARALDPLMGSWHLIGDHAPAAAAPAGRVEPGAPRVHTFDYDWPAAVERARRVGILLLVSAAEDALETAERDVSRLLATERKIAYRETATLRPADEARLFLEATGPVGFSVANPPAGNSAAGPLGLPAAAVGGPPQAELAGGVQPFNLAAGAPRRLVVSTPLQTLNVPLPQAVNDPNDIQNLAAATAPEVARVLNRAFIVAGFPLRAQVEALAVPAPPAFRLVLQGAGGVQFSIVAPGGGATDAAPNLGLAGGGPVNRRVGGIGPFALAAGAPQVLALTATNSTTIEFPSLPGATARELRAFLDREFAAALLPVRAVVPRVDLWVRRSVTDADGLPATVAGRHLADLVAEPAAVAAADRAALFGLVRAHALDRVRPSHENRLYLRSANLGNAPQAAARHRFFRLDMGAGAIAVAELPGSPVAATVPGAGSAIVELTWDPGAAAAGARLFVLAVCDHAADRPLEVPDTFATVEELDAFCERNPGAAYRAFAVGG